jgi:hypothetical protein
MFNLLHSFVAIQASQAMLVAGVLALSGAESRSPEPAPIEPDASAAAMASLPCVSMADLEFSYTTGLRLAGTGTPIGSPDGEPSLLVAVGLAVDLKVPIRISFARTDESVQISNGSGTSITLAPKPSLEPVSTTVPVMGSMYISIVGNSSTNQVHKPPPPAKAVLKPVTTCPRVL